MAEKSKIYSVKFSSELIRNAHKEFQKRIGKGATLESLDCRIENLQGEYWRLDKEDEFFLAYKDEIKRASLQYIYISKNSVTYTFSIRFWKHINNTETEVSISLPSRTDIELIFSIFDQEEKNKPTIPAIEKTANEEKEYPAKKLYTIERYLISCYVNKNLILELEEYLHKTIPYLESNTSENKWLYNLTITDAIRNEIMSSIKQFYLSMFPENIKTLTIYFYTYSENKISLCFGLTKEFSKLKITIYSENPREVVEGISTEIFRILNNYKTKNGFFYPPFWVEIIIYLFTIISFSSGLIYLLRQQYKTGSLLLLIFLMAAIYSLFRKFKPYTTFENKQNLQRDKWINWITFSILEFIIFTVIGGIILRLFGL